MQAVGVTATVVAGVVVLGAVVIGSPLNSGLAAVPEDPAHVGDCEVPSRPRFW